MAAEVGGFERKDSEDGDVGRALGADDDGVDDDGADVDPWSRPCGRCRACATRSLRRSASATMAGAARGRSFPAAAASAGGGLIGEGVVARDGGGDEGWKTTNPPSAKEAPDHARAPRGVPAVGARLEGIREADDRSPRARSKTCAR